MNDRRLQFSLRQLMIALTGIAIYAGAIAYFRPKHQVMVLVVPLIAMVIMGVVSLAPKKHDRWLRPVAVVAIGAGAFALGLWLNST
jgi:hypothetical protein